MKEVEMSEASRAELAAKAGALIRSNLAARGVLVVNLHDCTGPDGEPAVHVEVIDPRSGGESLAFDAPAYIEPGEYRNPDTSELAEFLWRSVIWALDEMIEARPSPWSHG